MIKAGSAGSIPDDVAALSGAIRRKEDQSQPLVDFLSVYGRTVFALNTVVVGLDAVEKGHPKPDSLDISWEPSDIKVAARSARQFVLESTMVSCAEAMLQFFLTFSRLPRFSALLLSWEKQKKSTGKETPAADKIRDIAEATLKNESYLVPAAMLMTHWRNRIVHTRSRAGLRHNEKSLLRASEAYIATHYKGLDVDRLLVHFEEGRPTLKDISSLVAMSINLAKEIDRTIYSHLTRSELDSWLDIYGLTIAIDKVRRETAPEKQNDSIYRAIRTMAPQLLDEYRRHYDVNVAP